MTPYPLPLHWGVSCGAILTQINEGQHGALGGAWPSHEAEATAREILASWWGVGDRDALDGILGWLVGSGHRDQWNTLLAELQSFGIDDDEEADPEDPEAVDEQRKKRFVAQNAAWAGGRSLVAWDAGRLVSVAGWGFLARLLGPEETWAHVMVAARAVQRTHASWAEFAHHYAFGRQFWREGQDAKLDAAVHALTTQPSSPWATLPWAVPLDVPGVPPLVWG